MIRLDVILNGDGCWPDLQEKPFEEIAFKAIALLQAGTESGKPSVMLRLEAADGRVFTAQTTLALFAMASDAFISRAGDPRR